MAVFRETVREEKRPRSRLRNNRGLKNNCPFLFLSIGEETGYLIEVIIAILLGTVLNRDIATI